MATATKEPTVILLPKLDLRTLELSVIGDSSLLSHRWSEKAKKSMRDKQTKQAKQAKEAKDPWADFCDSLYWISDRPDPVEQRDIDGATFGFPAIAFKAAAVDACSHVDGITKVEARGAFHIFGELVELRGRPVMREDMARVGMGTADLRYRAEFQKWRASFEVRYNANVLSPEQIVNLFNTGGFAIGIGDWRPQKDGSHGMFHVAVEGE